SYMSPNGTSTRKWSWPSSSTRRFSRTDEMSTRSSGAGAPESRARARAGARSMGAAMLARGGDARRGTLLSSGMRTPPIDRLESLRDRDLAALRERFQEQGFLPDVLARAESVAPRQLDAVSLPLVRWTLRRAGDAASRLALLFSYGEE